MIKILFVDDEVLVLDGIRRLLHHLRSAWQMTFVSGGEKALEIMARDSFDVIVTDIRMPGMDGIELLARTRTLYPGMVRIILSGQSDRDLTLKSAVNAHQYLSKPCDTESLTVTIARAVALKSSFTDPALQTLVSGAGTLPSIPSLYMDLIRKLEDPDCAVEDVANIIAKDPAMTAKILQLANSAFFGVRRRIAGPRDAVLYLGMDTLKSLALGVKVFSQFTARPRSRFSIDKVTNHAMLTGFLARAIAAAEGASKQDIEDSFVAGLLHDIGKLVLVNAAPEKYEEAIRNAEMNGEAGRQAEIKVFGISHAEVGTYLVWLWGLPDEVVEAIAYHHVPLSCPAPGFVPLTAVHAANAIANEPLDGNPGGPVSALDMDYLGQVGLVSRVPAWRGLIRQATEELRAA